MDARRRFQVDRLGLDEIAHRHQAFRQELSFEQRIFRDWKRMARW
jgi:hypothetical protein